MKKRYNDNKNNDDGHNSDDDNSDREIMKLIRKRDILKIYSKSVFINLWVLLKWLFKFIKNEILYNTRKIVEIDVPTYPNKPPSCLMDNRLGRHSYVKLKVWFTREAI
jgi:epoxide hydrolase 4